jgi:hypothetical protein
MIVMTLTEDTITTTPTTTPAEGDELDSFEEQPSSDLYREIHKGIRYAMFHTTMEAGALDVDDDDCVNALVARCNDLVDLLELHHHHEDVYVEPLVERHAPELGLTVEWQHDAVERGMFRLRVLAARLAEAAPVPRRRLAHRLYLELGRFTAMYLEHQLFEERHVMPALCAAISADEIDAVHDTLKQNIPPDVMAGALQVMLPALNVDERAAMLGGMSMAPPPVFAVFRAAAERALTPDQFAQVAARIGLH